MATRRHSKTPLVLTEHSRKVAIEAAGRDQRLRENIETVLGVKWDSLTDRDKLGSLTEFEEVGFAARSIAAAADGYRALEKASDEVRYGVSVEDRLQMVEGENERLRAQLAESEIQREKLRMQIVELTAQPAAAVHSDAA